MLYDWLRDMSFAFPEAFGLFILLPLLIWSYVSKSNRPAPIKVSTIRSFTASSWKNRFRHWPFILRLLAISCLIVALARPQKRNNEERTKGEGIDIVLCMDVSGSMGARDILPSRMEVAKEMAIEFVRSRPVDRIGLVVFSGESFSQSPVTTDKNSLITQIEALESRRYLVDGTVIGEGLATAVDRLSKSKSRSKVVILLTDGKEDPPETRLIDPVTALEIAKAQGVKVYTIGMSSGPQAVIELTGRHKDQQERMVDFIDEELLRRIANETGGRYFRARDRDGLKNIYNQIDKLEKSEVEITSYQRVEELFLPFVLAALAFLLLEILLRFTVLKKFP